MQVKFTTTDDVRAAIMRVGRTEDAQFSPDGKRLAIGGYEQNRLLVLDVDAGTDGVALSNALEVQSKSLNHPHGISWVDERTLIVANRDGEVTIFELPSNAAGSIDLDPLQSIGSNLVDHIQTPGSVSVFPIGLGIVELLVGNNYADTVSRHLLDQRDGYAVVASEVLIANGLEVPDGVAHSASGRWIAVSSHNSRSVFVYRNDGSLRPTSVPDGVLSGIGYPHGIRFAQDEKSLVVADAGAPVVHIFKSADGDWAGARTPSTSMRVIDDGAFDRGHYNSEEGGPKGLDLTHDGKLMVVSCEETPLGFFDVSTVLDQTDASRHETNLSEVDRARDALIRIIASGRASMEEKTKAIVRANDHEVAALIGSRSWRITAPLRRLTEFVGALAQMAKGARGAE